MTAALIAPVADFDPMVCTAEYTGEVCSNCAHFISQAETPVEVYGQDMDGWDELTARETLNEFHVAIEYGRDDNPFGTSMCFVCETMLPGSRTPVVADRI